MVTLKEINTIDELIDRVFSYNPDADFDLLRRAYMFSREAHQKQIRIEGSPYIEHPLAVASILTEMHLDTTTIAAGLLHDTVEDTPVTVDEIREFFGEDVSFLVDALTKLSRMEFKTSEEAYAENFRKMFLAMAKDLRVILIKFADRLHNMLTLEYLPETKRHRIARETQEIYAPLANRLGIGWLKTEFEDLGFKALMPEAYEDLVHKVAKKRDEQEGYLNEVVEIMHDKLTEMSIPGKIYGRIKHYYGIYQKMQRQKIPFEQIYDVFALRIITDTNANCYALLGLIHSLWTPVPGRFKDFIGAPKSNLYQSIHTTVIGPKGEKIEFQVRTEDMHRIAEEGIAAHWKYKEQGAVAKKDDKYFAWLRDIVSQSQKDTHNAKEFLETVKGTIFFDVVYALTPNGDVIELPYGSTPVDFAYSIHTAIGHQCTGARINGKIVPLRYTLRNGDTVEIMTTTGHHPSKDWLKFVKTHRARTRIKQWLKTKEREEAIEIGKGLVDKELRKHDLSPSLAKSKEILDIAKSYKINTYDDMFLSIGYGKVSPHQIVNKLVPEEEKTGKQPQKATKATEDRGIKIKGIDDIMFHRSKCCYPVPGEKVLGFVTRGRGVSIHTADCPNLDAVAVDKDRLVDVEWSTNSDMTYTVRISAYTLDKPGVLADLSVVISSENVNIHNIVSSATHEKRAYIDFTLEVKDKTQLDKLLKKITQVSGVIDVKRIKTA